MNNIGMDYRFQTRDPSRRLKGIAIVVVLHAFLGYALVSGLARKGLNFVKKPLEAVVIQEVIIPPPPPPPPPKKIEKPVAMPKLDAPPPPYVPPPEFTVTAPAPPAVMAAPTTSVPPPTTTVAATPAPAPVAAPVAKPTKVTAGMVCTKMAKPEMPSLSWSGEALYKVVATVKAGRVANIEVTSLRSGVDRKAQRALIAAIETTLKESYECPGDHVFEQEFQFKQE